MNPSATDAELAASPDQQFVRRLARMQLSRDRALNGLRRWTPDHIEPQQLVDVARATEGAGREDYEVRAAVGRVFATFHAGTSRISYGRDGVSIGGALRSLGSAGQGYGPRNPAVDRLLKQIVTAETYADLTELLTRAARELKADGQPPHWQTLIADLRDWRTSSIRNEVRLRWAQQFYTAPPKKTDSKKAN